VAMGILMQRNQFTRQQAFDVLRVASQSSNRKLADIASEVADTAPSRSPASRAPAASGSGSGRSSRVGDP
jgi:hypothetical protein